MSGKTFLISFFAPIIFILGVREEKKWEHQESIQKLTELKTEFSIVCSALGPIDRREDACRNVQGPLHSECRSLAETEKNLRMQEAEIIKAKNALRKEVGLDALIILEDETAPFWRCAERERSGTAQFFY